jgi:ATP-dependent exoDNAse (exonuclease V) beta subunit
MAADRDDLPVKERLALARGLLEGWKVSEALEPNDLTAAGDAFLKWVNQNWPGARWHREVPLMHRPGTGSGIRGTCDLALETTDGWVVIDHKSFSGRREECAEKASGYAPQLFAYADAIEAATGKKVFGCYIHMPLMGMVLEVKK